ncbi:MAG: LysM peptidoglycan-binding domain-containing protein [Pseudomonadota bacterium]
MANKREHTVKKGDTLSGLAKKNGLKSYKDIYNAPENAKFRKLRKDPNKIEPGDKVFIPPSPTTTPCEFKKEMPRMTINVMGKKKLIFVQQRWQYNWLTGGKVSKWTANEKKNYHNNIDKAIWAKWSGKYVLSVSGDSDFARAFATTEFDVSFDIKRVSSGGHWNVNVTKIPKGDWKGSKVNWTTQTITLDSEDHVAVVKDAATGTKQKGAVHEFGHAIGNTSHIEHMHADEYKDASAYKADIKSMMNCGMELRKRHADHLISELNKMIPKTTWKVKAIK